jgi:Protein of unknown function (DUF3180)
VKRMRPGSLFGLGIAGVVVGFLLETAATGAGAATLVPPLSLPLTLVVIAAFVVGFAVPIRQATRGKSQSRIDPFQAARVAVLAKACSLAGALLTGTAVGIIVFMLTRSVIPVAGSIWLTVIAGLGAIALLVGGLIAERMCTLPPEDDDHKQPEKSGA